MIFLSGKNIIAPVQTAFYETINSPGIQAGAAKSQKRPSKQDTWEAKEFNANLDANIKEVQGTA